MQILSAEQIRAWDEFTILNEPVSSIALMERAATACFEWLKQNNFEGSNFSIFCGKGNNGGDGLALARLLAANDSQVTVHILEFGHKGTEDFQINLARLHGTSVTIRFIQTEENLYPIPETDVIIDALFGSGLNRPLEGLTAKVVHHINAHPNEVIAIDIPSGMFTDRSSKNNIVVKARHTLSFQCYKMCFVVAENEEFFGEVHVLDIGLLPEYLLTIQPEYIFTDKELLKSWYKPRKKFSHKGKFGHALIIAGSYGKMGAAVLASKACLHAGAGLTSAHIPTCGYVIMQTAVPEVMVKTDADEKMITGVDELETYNALGIGPGIGTSQQTEDMLKGIFQKYQKPVVIDADGLNCIAANKKLLSKVPHHSILTPHPKEFLRLFGDAQKSIDDFDRIHMAKEMAKKHQLFIVLKGYFTFIATPDNIHYFNTTGNPGMAKGGSGDVLTGIITGLLAQSYLPLQACLLGTYLHGKAGDLAAGYLSPESMVASHIIEYLGEAFLSTLS